MPFTWGSRILTPQLLGRPRVILPYLIVVQLCGPLIMPAALFRAWEIVRAHAGRREIQWLRNKGSSVPQLFRTLRSSAQIKWRTTILPRLLCVPCLHSIAFSKAPRMGCQVGAMKQWIRSYRTPQCHRQPVTAHKGLAALQHCSFVL